MFQYDVADTEDFEQIIIQAVQRILEVPDPDDFLHWAREVIPSLLMLPEHMDVPERGRFATLLGITIWNATPLPQYGFTVRPIATPAPNARCHCGSGLRYRDCCSKLKDAPELSSEVIWMVLLNELSEADLKVALKLGAVPEPLLAIIADRWLDEDRPRRVITLLEPLFAGALDELAGDYEPVFDLLCDAYDRLNFWRKRDALLARVCAEGSRPLQASAWQRRSTMHIDAGDFNLAEQAFTSALRSDPDNPGTALLEITLLTTQNKIALARERAQFWLHRFQRLGDHDARFMSFLELAGRDPQRALMHNEIDDEVTEPRLFDLCAWVLQVAQRAIPTYTLDPVISASQPQHKSLSREVTSVITSQDGERELLPLEQLAELESAWHARFPVEKPPSTALMREDEELIWETPEWLDFVLEHPELADSLDVLDDLVGALDAYPEDDAPWISPALVQPLLERAWAITIQLMPPNDASTLPWEFLSNRPLLRLLFRRYLYQTEASNDLSDAIAPLEMLLRLNPHDHHGARGELMNLYLRNGDNEQAVALALRFPNDTLAEMVYGEVLALYRLGLEARARTVLTAAARRMPHVSLYLTRKRIKQPPIDPAGVAVGGEDQAWFYREDMRAVWAAEPGVLDWLKRITA